jgi:uncharacterized membrane protein
MRPIVHVARFFHPLAAATVVGLVFAQVYLIAEYVFGNATALSAHMTLGKIVVLFELIVLLTAVIGWWRQWTEVWLSLALVVVGGLQVSLAKDLGNSSQVHALHGMLALAVVLLASLIAIGTWRHALPRVANVRARA